LASNTGGPFLCHRDTLSASIQNYDDGRPIKQGAFFSYDARVLSSIFIAGEISLAVYSALCDVVTNTTVLIATLA